MKRIFALLLAATLLSACAAKPGADAAGTPAPDKTQTDASAPEGEAAPAGTQDPVPADLPDAVAPYTGDGLSTLDYDEIRPVTQWGSAPALMAKGYFAVCKDSLWGLIRADGTELLPCLAQTPPQYCGWDWHWDVVGMSWDELDEYSAQLTAMGEEILNGGHDSDTTRFFYDLDAEGLRTTVGMMAQVAEVEPVDLVPFGTLLPVAPRHEEGGNGDPVYPGKAEGDYFYLNAETGEQIFIQTDAAVTNANWFFDEALAPVQLDSANWAYADRTGTLVTEAVYAPVYCEDSTYDESVSNWVWGAPTLAATLQNGYAAVQRADTGTWGLLDSTGGEIVPAVYAGCAWDGDTLWLRLQESGPWQRFTVSF